MGDFGGVASRADVAACEILTLAVAGASGAADGDRRR